MLDFIIWTSQGLVYIVITESVAQFPADTFEKPSISRLQALRDQGFTCTDWVIVIIRWNMAKLFVLVWITGLAAIAYAENAPYSRK